MRDFSGHAAVVSGAGSGVGAAVALALARRGFAVALVGRRPGKIEDTAARISEAGGVAGIYPCDVSSLDEVRRLAEEIARDHGPPSVLFNNAGIHGGMSPIQESDPELWLRVLQINTLGIYLMCRHFMGGMIAGGWGRILNVSSAASIAEPGNLGSQYQLSKVALNWFTRQLAAELAGTGVTANALHPGEVKTEMWAAIRDDAHRRGPEGEGARGWAKMVDDSGGDPPEKAAELVLELLEPESDEVNGGFLWIKEGIQAPRPAW